MKVACKTGTRLHIWGWRTDQLWSNDRYTVWPLNDNHWIRVLIVNDTPQLMPEKTLQSMWHQTIKEARCINSFIWEQRFSRGCLWQVNTWSAQLRLECARVRKSYSRPIYKQLPGREKRKKIFSHVPWRCGCYV